MLFRRRALFLAGLFVAVSCSDAGNPLGPPDDSDPRPGGKMALDCSVQVATGALTCQQPTPGTGGALGNQITVGGQNIYVRLAAANHVLRGDPLNAALDTFDVDVTVQNLMKQALGTADGVTLHPDGVRLTFEQDPNGSPGGTPEIENAVDNTFDPKYFQYDLILRPDSVSMPKTWSFSYDPTVTTSIKFRILVEADVQFDPGWVEVSPRGDTLAVGETLDLDGIAYNKYSDVLSTTPTWTTTGHATTVDGATGMVNAVSEGVDTVTASYVAQIDMDAELDTITGTALIVVNNGVPVVAVDTIDAIENVTIPLPAGRLTDNITDTGNKKVVAATIATAEGGIAITQEDGSFTYLSDAGFSGEDSFEYTVSDGFYTATGLVVVNVADSNYWYVQAGVADGGDGRDRFPFNEVAEATAVAGAGSILVLDNGAQVLTGPVTLGAGQSLIGQGIPTSIVQTANGQPVTILAAGTQPELTSATGSTVTVGSGNVIKGVAISSTAGASGISGAGFGTLRLWYSTVQATGGPAMVLSGGNLDADSTVTVSSSGSAGSGISLTNVTGSMTTTGGAISGAAGAAVSVSGSSVSVNYGGSVTQGSSAALLAVSGGHTGTLTFPGTLSATAGTGLQFNDADGTYNFPGSATLAGGDAGVDIGNASAGTFTFGTGTAITSPSGTAFAVNGSSPVVTYSGSITQANNARLVDVSEQPGGTVTFQTGTLSATGGTGILLSNADGTVSFNGTTTLNGGDAGVDVVAGSGGTFAFSATTSITNPTGVGLNAATSAPTSLTYAGSIAANANRPVSIDGGCGTITVSGSISSTGQGILVQNCASGAVAFNGSKTLNTGANQAVTLANNTTGTVSFGGGNLAITTTGAIGFGATGSGTVQVTGANNTISTGTGTGLSLANVSTGASGVTFRSVSTGAAANGIALNTLTGVGVTVSGDGATAGSGGTISGTTGHGVSLQSLGSLTTGVVLNYVNVSTGAAGISSVFGTTFGTLSATGSALSSTGGPALNLTTGALLVNLASLSSSGSSTTGVSLTGVSGTLNTSGGTVAGGATGAFTVSGGTVGGTIASTVSQGNNAPVVAILGAHGTGTLTFSGTVSANAGTGLQFTDADGTYGFTGTTTLAGGDAGIDIASASSGTVNVNPSGGNTAAVTNPSGVAISIVGGTADLTYRGNVTQANNVSLLSVTGGHSGDIAFPSGTLSATNGNGLQFDNSDGTYNFGGTVTLAGGDAGIDVTNGSSGTFSFPATATITSPSTGNLVSILNSAPNFTYSGAFTKANNNVTGILVSSNTGGSVTFNGSGVTKSISSGNAAAVNLANNTGATITFAGGSLAITSGSGAGLTATGGGTLNVTGLSNAIVSGTGTALTVQNTTIGVSGLSFVSVSHTGGANGIFLSNTGSTNGLQVTGAGTNGSGGTITGTTGSDGATSGNGIYLNGTRNVSLSWMALSGHQNNGLYGTGVRGLTVNKVRITGTNGTNNSGAFDESAVNLVDLGGAVKMTNSRFDGGAYNAVRVENISGTAPALDSLVFENDTVESMQGSTADVRSTAMLVSLQDGTADTRIRNNRVTYWWGNAIHVLVQGTATGTSRITNNFVDNGNGALAGAGGIWVAGGNHTYNISGNTVRHTNGTAISADRVNFGTLMSGTIDGNFVGVSGDANSGSFTGIGIFASHHGPSTTTVKISNNVLRQINGSASGAITTQAGDALGFGGSGTMNATISGNNIQESGTLVNNAQHGILVTHGMQSGPPTDTDQGCYDVLSNTIANFNSGSAAASQNRIRLNQRFSTTTRWPGYTGSNTDGPSLIAYLLGRNTAVNGSVANSSTGGFNNTSPAGSACPQPLL